MLFRAAWAVSLTVFVVALARELVASANAVAISGDRSSLDGYQGHESLSLGRREGIIPRRRAARKTAKGKSTTRPRTTTRTIKRAPVAPCGTDHRSFRAAPPT